MDEHPGSQRIPLTLNKYLYGNADPVNHVDPSGNFFITNAGSTMILQTMPRLAMATGSAGLATAVKVRVALYVAAATYGTYKIVDTAIKTEIRKCIEDAKAGGKKCKLDFSMLIVGDDNQEVRRHISDALGSFYPARVHRQKPTHSRGWLASQRGPGKPCNDLSKDCDEYPMATHVEGGQLNSPSLRSVDASQNRSVGSTTRWLHEKCSIRPNDSYHVIPLKGMPITGYICGR